jgi:hypothetical protein
MPTTIAEHFMDELSGWNDAIDYYNEEIEEFEKRLSDLVNRNTIPHLAENAEFFWYHFLLQKQSFLLLKNQFLIMQTKLSKNETPITNDSITEQLKVDQTSLREKMKQTEKNYIDLKFDCQRFLAESAGT